MKKVVVVIIAFLYLSTSIGATVHLHYCMGSLADWGLGHNRSKICGKCGMEKSEETDNGCCRDEQKTIKNDTDQRFTEIGLRTMQVVASALPVSFIEIPCNDFSSVTKEDPISDAPPRSAGVAVYIRHCVFLI